MTKQSELASAIEQGYHTTLPNLHLGIALQNGEVVPGAAIQVVLKTLNRHGLIAGATGTGKTKTLQLMCELLSDAGISTLAMDIKGDLSGLLMPGEINEKIADRQQKIGVPVLPKGFPVEFLSISNEPGVRMRSTVGDFGPVLFSQMLDLNDTQLGLMTVLFKFSKDKNLPLIDLKDLKRLMSFAMEEGKVVLEKEYGKMSSTSFGTILRKIVELEQQGAEVLFGEPAFDVRDLAQTTSDGKGTISILRVTDLQDKPKLFSTFMLGLLSQLYNQYPETGDSDKPKLVIFIDEAHLIFNTASAALQEKIESIIKLIRSKSVGVIFCTQSPTDIPASVLGQLGLKIQHALRAFTANDRKAIKLTAENYPVSPFYKTAEVLTELGIGEALLTALDEQGRPTPLVTVLLQAPRSRLGTLSTHEIENSVHHSRLAARYADNLDRQSAYELLNNQLSNMQVEAAEMPTADHPASHSKEPDSMLENLSKNTLFRRIATTMIQEIAKIIAKALGIGGRRR